MQPLVNYLIKNKIVANVRRGVCKLKNGTKQQQRAKMIL